MKRCPSCNQQFSDEYSFCLDDGTTLVPAGVTIAYEPEQATVVRTGREQDTVVRGSGGTIPPPTSAPAASKGVPFYMWLFPVLGLVIGGGLILAYIVISSLLGPKNTVAVTNTNSFITNSSTPYSTPTPMPTGTVSATPFPTFPSANSTPSVVPTAPPPPPQLASYPATTRLKFARGAVSTSFSGDVNPGGSRSVVLACRAGQSLSANVSSAGGCVTVRGGGSSYRTYTSSGDNYVTLSNSCSNVADFSVSITVL